MERIDSLAIRVVFNFPNERYSVTELRALSLQDCMAMIQNEIATHRTAHFPDGVNVRGSLCTLTFNYSPDGDASDADTVVLSSDDEEEDILVTDSDDDALNQVVDDQVDDNVDLFNFVDADYVPSLNDE